VGGKAGTSEFTDSVIEAMRRGEAASYVASEASSSH
jgi:hypothetical protein